MSLTLMTYNILNGGVGREHLIEEVVQAAQPDLLLQEVMQPALVTHLAHCLGMRYSIAKSNSIRHVALLSRLPIIACRVCRPHPPIRTAILEATLAPQPGKRLHLIGVHLAAFPTNLIELWRAWEIAVVLRRARRYAAAPCLIVGDFNAVALGDQVNVRAMPPLFRTIVALQGGRFPRYVLRAVRAAGFTDCYRQIHPNELGFTLPPPAPLIRLDYVFANPVLVKHLIRCQVVREPTAVEQASDHYPLLTEFQI